jgi:hypothetical protein
LIVDVPACNLIIPLDIGDISTVKICGWGAIGSSQSTDFLIGQSLLHSTYLIFDTEKNQIGFSAA